MTLVRWDPSREMNRLLTSFFDTPSRPVAAGQRRWLPAMDLEETPEAFVLRADLPGLTQADVSIEFENDVLTVAGARESATEKTEGQVRRVERQTGSFKRSLRLPEGVDAEAIVASFSNGVLEVTVPKPEQRKPRRVAITVGGDTKAVEAAEPATEEPAAA